MRIGKLSPNEAEISSTLKSRIDFYFLGGTSGNFVNNGWSLVPLDLQSVIATMIKAQTSQGSPGPSSSDAMSSQHFPPSNFHQDEKPLGFTSGPLAVFRLVESNL